MLSLEHINIQNPQMREVIANLICTTGIEKQVLCRLGSSVFVDNIHLLKEPDRSMPANCSRGCLYVSGKHMAVPIDQLDEMCFIEVVE